jgi:protein-tyrosine-phosphatase
MDQSHVDQLRTRFDVDPRKIVWLGDFDPEPVKTRAIPDPYGGDATVFEGCYRRIARCSARLAAALRPTAAAVAPHTHPRAR